MIEAAIRMLPAFLYLPRVPYWPTPEATRPNGAGRPHGAYLRHLQSWITATASAPVTQQVLSNNVMRPNLYVQQTTDIYVSTNPKEGGISMLCTYYKWGRMVKIQDGGMIMVWK